MALPEGTGPDSAPGHGHVPAAHAYLGELFSLRGRTALFVDGGFSAT